MWELAALPALAEPEDPPALGLHIRVWCVVRLQDAHGACSLHWERRWLPKQRKHRPAFWSLSRRSCTDKAANYCFTFLVNADMATGLWDFVTFCFWDFRKCCVSAMCFAILIFSQRNLWHDSKGVSCWATSNLKWCSAHSFLMRGGK